MKIFPKEIITPTCFQDLDAGDLSARIQWKNSLQCKNFTWFIDKVWPELFIYNRDVQAWGSVRRQYSSQRNRKC